MTLYPADYLEYSPFHSQITGWQASVSYILQPVADYVAPPLDAQTNYTYPGEGQTPDLSHNTPGTINKPSTVVQGSETSTFAYNPLAQLRQPTHAYCKK
jgi:hypothetical protein